MFLMYRAGNPAQQQIDTYDEHQLPVFLLLFCPVLEAVKQVQLAFEGPVAEASPIASAIEEITALGVGPLPTIVVNRTFVWKDTDKDIFEDLCRACSKVPTT